MVSYSSNTPIDQGGEAVPLFQQVANRVSDEIVEGAIAEGEQVPSINEFATAWRINPATALKGISQLVADGVLYKQRGIGTFVAPGARQRLVERRRDDLAARFVQPLLREAARLGLSPRQVIDLISKEES